MSTHGLTEEQYAILDAVKSGFSTKQVQTVGGLAGTGKTTILHVLYEELREEGHRPLVCTPTGKAADVMAQKGLRSARTIHSALYSLRETVTRKHALTLADGSVQEYDVVDEMKWDWKGSKHDVLLVDEASMVPYWIYQDILDNGLTCVFFGDHGQLPPIKSAGIHVMATPDYKLETVHRNAGPIAKFCHHLRQGNKPETWDGGGVTFLAKATLTDVAQQDQVICAMNKTRTKFNAAWRKAKGYRQIVESGERVISLYNSRRKKLFNGTQAVVLETAGQNQMTIETRNDEMEVQFLPEIFGMEKYPDFRDLLHRGHPFDYAYCLTCHKAQGSEWDRVAVIDEGHRMPWQTPGELHRWRYTAASRAKRCLTWVKSFAG